MIKKLKLKIILVTMSVMVAVFAVIFVTLNIFMQRVSTQQTEKWLEFLAQQSDMMTPFRNPGGLTVSPPPKEIGGFIGSTADYDMVRSTRFFCVKLDEDGGVFETYIEMMYDFTEEEAAEYALTAYANGADKGRIGSYQYLIAEKAYGSFVVFAERSAESRVLSQLLEVSLIVAAGSFIVLFGVILVLSEYSVKPVKVAFHKQQCFVSDASHELKTPLTIISANADVLGSQIGENQWISSIKTQAKRMEYLIKELLSLAHIDEAEQDIILSGVELSKVVLMTALEFEVRAFEENKTYDYRIADSLTCKGDENRIKQILSILIDNAFSHSGENGKITVTLTHEGSRHRLSVHNTGEGIADREKDRIFERFYRSDESRSRETGGYGLGLAIAKSVADKYKWKIHVNGKQGEWIEFVLLI